MPALHLDHLEVPCTPAELHAIRTGRIDVLERLILSALADLSPTPAHTGDRGGRQ